MKVLRMLCGEMSVCGSHVLSPAFLSSNPWKCSLCFYANSIKWRHNRRSVHLFGSNWVTVWFYLTHWWCLFTSFKNFSETQYNPVISKLKRLKRGLMNLFNKNKQTTNKQTKNQCWLSRLSPLGMVKTPNAKHWHLTQIILKLFVLNPSAFSVFMVSL